MPGVVLHTKHFLVLAPRKPFSCRNCWKQKAYVLTKPFRCSTYKKTGGGGILPMLELASRSTPGDFALFLAFNFELSTVALSLCSGHQPLATTHFLLESWQEPFKESPMSEAAKTAVPAA